MDFITRSDTSYADAITCFVGKGSYNSSFFSAVTVDVELVKINRSHSISLSE